MKLKNLHVANELLWLQPKNVTDYHFWLFYL